MRLNVSAFHYDIDDYQVRSAVLINGVPGASLVLNAATVKAVNTSEFKEYLAKEGSELVGSTPEHLATFVRAEVAKNAELIRSAALKPE